MSMFVSSLNSGSNANCYYLGLQDEAILIDAGLSCRETVKRLKRIGRSIKEVKAIFVSHEHSDHISGIPVLARKFRIPVFLTRPTLDQLQFDIDEDLIRVIESGQTITVGRFAVTPFRKLHDAHDPHSFIVRSQEVCVGVFTDIGSACDNVVHYFRQCHAAFLEANYDQDMLMQGRYPWPLKRRISSEKGHLSNDQALELFVSHRPPFMTHLFLAHLSRENNSPRIVQNTFARAAGSTEIIVASRDRETPLYHIRNKPGLVKAPHRTTPPPVRQRGQLSLF